MRASKSTHERVQQLMFRQRQSTYETNDFMSTSLGSSSILAIYCCLTLNYMHSLLINGHWTLTNESTWQMGGSHNITNHVATLKAQTRKYGKLACKNSEWHTLLNRAMECPSGESRHGYCGSYSIDDSVLLKKWVFCWQTMVMIALFSTLNSVVVHCCTSALGKERCAAVVV